MSIRVRLTQLHCSNANEGGPFNSDEPYVITATIAPGGPLGKRLLFATTQIFHNVDEGDNRHPDLDLLNENIQNPFAVVAQVVEHDDSEKQLIVGAATLAAQAAFINAMANGADLSTLRTVVATALHNGVVAVALPLVDDDDAIGNAAAFTVSAAQIAALGVGSAFNVSREVSGDSTRYTLTFEIRHLA